MRTVYTSQTIAIPEGVSVNVKARNVIVKGPLGTLKRSFKFISLDINKSEDGKSLKVDIWFGNRESNASIRFKILILYFNF